MNWREMSEAELLERMEAGSLGAAEELDRRTMTFDEFLCQVDSSYAFEKTVIRYGQHLWQMLHDVRPDLTERLKFSSFDPYEYERGSIGIHQSIGVIRRWW